MTNQQPPALQPGQFEHDLFVYGPHKFASVTMKCDVAEKCAQSYVGRNMILPGVLVRIISVRLEDDPAYPGVRGRVIAVCEVVSQLENVSMPWMPFRPEMEYK